MRKQKGFSLIELLIVVAIILIIAAIAIPNLIRARISANESSAAAGTRTVATADIQYQAAWNQYATSVSALGPPSSTGCATSGSPPSTAACLIDFTIVNSANTPKSGYVYVANTGTGGLQTFVEGATASTPGRTGNKSFCAIEDGVVHSDPNGAVNITTTSANCIAAAPIGN